MIVREFTFVVLSDVHAISIGVDGVLGFEVRCSEQKAPEVAAALHSPWLSCPLGRELLRRNVLASDCCASAEAVTVVRESEEERMYKHILVMIVSGGGDGGT